jgi:arginyl-tRNA synthetase
VLGADHHGYVARMRAALAASGEDPERFEALIMQLVNVIEGGERTQMSKRRGEFVTLDELISDIGTDAARFLLVQRSHDTTVDLDLDLARSESQENPVYYVQYAHARITSILRKAGEDAVTAALADPDATLSVAAEPSERALVKRLLELPDEVRTAGELRAPHRLTAYAMATAADFHGFYRDCQVVGAEGERVEAARLAVCVATRRAIARTLDLLGVSAPERM